MSGIQKGTGWRQRADKAGHTERSEPGSPPQLHTKKEQGRGGEPGADTLRRGPGGGALSEGGRQRPTDREHRAAKRAQAGRGESPKSRGRGREGKSPGGLEVAGHSPEPRGRQGRGRRTAADASRASGLNVPTGEAPAAAANRPEEGRRRVRGSEVRDEGRLRVRTTGRAPTAGKDGNAEGPRQLGPPPRRGAGAAGKGRDCASVTSRRRGGVFRTARARPRPTYLHASWSYQN